MKTNPIFAFILLVVLMTPVYSFANEVVIIANKDVPAYNLTESDIGQIFLGKKSTWDNDERITFVIQNSMAVHDAFLKSYVHRSVFQYENYWKKQVFTGKGKPPQSFGSDQDIVDFVSRTPGAIGYVTSDAATGGTKTITVR